MDIGSLVGYLTVDDSEFDKGLDGALGKLDTFGGKGAAMAAAAGVAIGGAVVAGVVGAMNVEAANDKLTAQLGLTEAESERIGKAAGGLYAKGYGDSLTGVNGAAAAVIGSIQGMREASSEELQKATRDALNFAEVFEVDVAGAAKSAGILVKNGLAKDATEAFDLLTVAAQEAGPAMVDPIMEAANEYGVNFQAMGISGRAAMAMLVDASKGGEIALDKAGDAVKEFGIRATDLGDTGAQEALEGIGLSGQDMANRLLAGGQTASDAFYEITDGLLGITDPAKQAEAAVALFGTPLEDLGKDQIPGFLAAMQQAGGELENVAGATDKLDETLNSNASKTLETFKRQAMTTFVDVVGGKALPAVQEVASFLADTFGPAVEEVTEFLEDNETAVKAIAAAVGAAGLVYATYSATVRTVSAVTKAWAAGQAILNAVMAMNPILLVVMAVAALAAGLIYAYNESETFRDIVNGVFDAVKRGAGNAVGFMIDGFRMLLTVFLTIADGIVSGAATALSWVPGLGEKLQQANTAFDNMKDGILDTLDEAAQAAYGFGEKTGNNAAGGMSATQQAAWNAARGVGGQMASGVGAAAGDTYNSGYGVGKNAAQGLVDGMNAKRAAVSGAAAVLGGVVGVAMRQATQVKSPSRVTMNIGNMIGEGLVVGMAQMRPAVAAEVARLADLQALSTLAGQVPTYSRQPATATSPLPAGSSVAARLGAGAAAAGGGPLVAIEHWHEESKSPDRLANEMAVMLRTSGGVG